MLSLPFAQATVSTGVRSGRAQRVSASAGGVTIVSRTRLAAETQDRFGFMRVSFWHEARRGSRIAPDRLHALLPAAEWVLRGGCAVSSGCAQRWGPAPR